MNLLRDENLLPIVRACLQEIETATGADVLVEQMEGPHLIGSPFACKFTWAWPPVMKVHYQHSLEEAVRGGPKPYAGVYHELLHLHRYFVQRVPAIDRINGMWRVEAPASVTNPEQLAAIAAIDRHCSAHGLEMALEHVVIDKLLSEAFECEVSRSSLVEWDAMVPDLQSINHVQRWGCMLEWFASEFSCTDQAVKLLASQVMDQLGILGKTQCLATTIRELMTMPDPVEVKEGMVVETFDTFGLPLPDLRLIYSTDTAPGFVIKQAG